MMSNGMTTNVLTFPHSYSRLTVYDIRYSTPAKKESNQQHLERLSRTYGLTALQVRILITTPNLDLFGRASDR